MTSLRLIQAPDCRTYPCKEECCSWGVDVEPEERQRMIQDGIATEADFTGPQLYEGEPLYRTALSGRGCVFLLPTRGRPSSHDWLQTERVRCRSARSRRSGRHARRRPDAVPPGVEVGMNGQLGGPARGLEGPVKIDGPRCKVGRLLHQ